MIHFVSPHPARPSSYYHALPVFVELCGHLFTQSMNQVGHGLLAVVGPRRLEFLVQRLDDALLVGQSLFEVVDSLLVNVGVERDLGQQLRLAVLRVQTQSTLAVASTRCGRKASHRVAVQGDPKK